MELKIIKKREMAVIPKYSTNGAAAADLYACIEENIILKPGDRVLVPTGIAISLPSKDYVALVFARSGLAIKKGICLTNGVGVIDSDYRGEISVGLCNMSDEPYTILVNERIAQLAIMPVIPVIFKETSNLDQTERENNGFGSTGRK